MQPLKSLKTPFRRFYKNCNHNYCDFGKILICIKNAAFRNKCLLILVFTCAVITLVVLTPNIRRSGSKSREYYPTSNFPSFYDRKHPKPTGLNETCAQFPPHAVLRLRSLFWQVQEYSNGVFYLLNAYYDNRIHPSVRILGLASKQVTIDHFFCQLWYEGEGKPVIVKTKEIAYIWRPEWKFTYDYHHEPYMITCELPSDKNKIPGSVSLVEDPCETATNNLKVKYKAGKTRREFVVCVKGLNYRNRDISGQLVEWIELVNLLGADKINFYYFYTHPNVKKVLDYYREKEFVEITPISAAGDYPNYILAEDRIIPTTLAEKRYQEVIMYNDCLYKHLYEFRYIIPLDIDEIILPLNGTWHTLLEQSNRSAPTLYAKNVYFWENLDETKFPKIPLYMKMLRSVTRMRDFTKRLHYVKGFHDIERVLTLHNHFPISCIKECLRIEWGISKARLHHYRNDCHAGEECDKENSMNDYHLWKYKGDLIKRVKRSMYNLGLLNETGRWFWNLMPFSG